MQLAILLLCFTSICASREDVSNYTFAEYKKHFGRSYQEGDGEHEMREALFNKRIAEVKAHNAKDLSWKLGMNHFSDRTPEELKQLNGYNRWMATSPGESTRSGGIMGSSSFLQIFGSGNESETACTAHGQKCTGAATPCCDGQVCGPMGLCKHSLSPPESVDWATLPTAMQVPDQGACGSCWAVAATSAIQFQAVINTGHRFQHELSSQNILSCTPNEMECGGQGGCKGATAELGFDWLQRMGRMGGVHTITQQEYKAYATSDRCPKQLTKMGKSLRASWSSTSMLQSMLLPGESLGPAVSITGWAKIKENSAEDMIRHLSSVGPLVASVVGATSLQSYSSGVLGGCNNFVIDHAVTMMGYGKDKQRDMLYWKIRNSWGNHWGEKGYFRLQRFYPQKTEPCGIDTDPSKGVACKDKKGPEGKYPTESDVCGACGILGDTAYPIGTEVPKELL